MFAIKRKVFNRKRKVFFPSQLNGSWYANEMKLNGGNVKEWIDDTGKSNAKQDTSTDQPAQKSENGQNGINCDESNDFLDSGLGTSNIESIMSGNHCVIFTIRTPKNDGSDGFDIDDTFNDIAGYISDNANNKYFDEMTNSGKKGSWRQKREASGDGGSLDQIQFQIFDTDLIFVCGVDINGNNVLFKRQIVKKDGTLVHDSNDTAGLNVSPSNWDFNFQGTGTQTMAIGAQRSQGSIVREYEYPIWHYSVFETTGNGDQKIPNAVDWIRKYLMP